MGVSNQQASPVGLFSICPLPLACHFLFIQKRSSRNCYKRYGCPTDDVKRPDSLAPASCLLLKSASLSVGSVKTDVLTDAAKGNPVGK